VDARTSHIIVSCNDALFQRVDELVKTIDQRAKEARPTVRVVPLATADPSVVSGTVKSLFTKVSVSSSGSAPRTTRPGSSQSNAPQGGGNSGGGAPDITRDPEMIRRMMESRMRGGDSGGGFGGPPGGGFFGRGGR
jgi:hypothetical protein